METNNKCGNILIDDACKEVREEGACFGCCFECPINYGRGLSEDWYDDDEDDDDFDWDDEDWEDED